MKKINSIDYGGKVIGLGIFFTFIISSVIYILPLNKSTRIFSVLFKLSFGVGIVILAGFSLWLIIELHQDKRLEIYYESKRNTKIDLGHGQYECQACGNRKVKLNDMACNVCGVHFNKKVSKR